VEAFRSLTTSQQPKPKPRFPTRPTHVWFHSARSAVTNNTYHDVIMSDCLVVILESAATPSYSSTTTALVDWQRQMVSSITKLTTPALSITLVPYAICLPTVPSYRKAFSNVLSDPTTGSKITAAPRPLSPCIKAHSGHPTSPEFHRFSIHGLSMPPRAPQPPQRPTRLCQGFD
jgi:hypothetical protein